MPADQRWSQTGLRQVKVSKTPVRVGLVDLAMCGAPQREHVTLVEFLAGAAMR
jgi:hypothetical protein